MLSLRESSTRCAIGDENSCGGDRHDCREIHCGVNQSKDGLEPVCGLMPFTGLCAEPDCLRKQDGCVANSTGNNDIIHPVMLPVSIIQQNETVEPQHTDAEPIPEHVQVAGMQSEPIQ